MGHVIIVLILVGVGLYLINTIIPMDAKIKQILNVFVVVVVALWVVSLFFPSLFHDVPIRPIG